MIRHAQTNDIESMVPMLRRFFDASGYGSITAFDADSLDVTLRRLMANPDGVLLVVESDGSIVGVAGALVYPFYFNTGHKTSQEMFWWVDPQHRGCGAELFKELRREVKACGAESLSMIALETLSPERVGSFYEREGFRPSERSFIGRI